MRQEITESQPWRPHAGVRANAGANWSSRRRVTTQRTTQPVSLNPELVDAAFADDLPSKESVGGMRRDPASHGPDIVQSLSMQLSMLETQREQLQQLLAQAQQ